MPNKAAFFLLFALALVALFHSRQGHSQQADGPLEPSAQRLAKRARDAGGHVGVAVVEIGSGDTVVAHRADQPHDPASNMKLITAWAALRRLGPQHQYLSGLYGKIDGDRVPELVLRGEGDPSLEMRHLHEMVARLKRAGVVRVGDILVDQTRFDGQYTPPAFESQPNEWAAFRAPVAAVSLAANTVLFEVRPRRSGEKARLAAVPASFVSMAGRVRTTDPGDPENVRMSLARDGHKLKATAGGSLPEGSSTVRFWRRVDDPTLLAGYGLHDACRDLGIAVEGTIKEGRVSKVKHKLLSAHRSQPLARLLFALGKFSNNFYAEMIFKSLGGRPASFDAASRAVEEELDRAGIDRNGMRFNNGSGLFDAGKLTPLGTARLLAHAAQDPRVAPEMLAHLSIGGVDGTVRHRLKKHADSRRIRAKTGTLAAVSAMSGYVLGADGKPSYAFSVMVNDVRGKAIGMRKHIDRFVASIASL